MTKSTAIGSTYVKAQRAAFGAKGGRAAHAIGRSRGGWTTKVHALTDVIGRRYALMLTAGNVSDVKVAPVLLERAGRIRYLLRDKGYDADRLRRLARDAGAIPVIPADATASAPSATTRTATAVATSSRTPSTAARISAASTPAATSSPPTPSWASRSQPPSPSGSKRGLALEPEPPYTVLLLLRPGVTVFACFSANADLKTC